LHISESAEDPLAAARPCLDYILQGIKQKESMAGITKRESLPISPTILGKIKATWQARAYDPDKVMLWAAFCLGYFEVRRDDCPK
jgi:hypothetical protein